MKYTAVKQKIASKLGADWTHESVAQDAGLSRWSVTIELICTGGPGCKALHNPDNQRAIARAVGIPAKALFGDHLARRLANGRKRVSVA